MQEITLDLVKSILKTRKKDSSKNDFGHCLLINGNLGKMGAAVISTLACLRSGAGLVSVNVPFQERQIVQIAVPEAMIEFRETKEINYSKFNAIAIGSGFGIDQESKELLELILKNVKCPLLLDADALTLISQSEHLISIPKKTIITPHEREFDRLFGDHRTHEERILSATKIAFEQDIIIVLKSSKTIITFSNKIFVNTIGNAGLAKGGSGDALGGIITSFLGQGYNLTDAAILGVYLHSLAADYTLKSQSEESMSISDVINNLSKAFNHLHESQKI